MCGGPKPPKPSATQLAAEADARAMREAEMQAQREERTRLKERRTELKISESQRYGRRSLLSGGRGGEGFAAPGARSLLAQVMG